MFLSGIWKFCPEYQLLHEYHLNCFSIARDTGGKSPLLGKCLFCSKQNIRECPFTFFARGLRVIDVVLVLVLPEATADKDFGVSFWKVTQKRPEWVRTGGSTGKGRRPVKGTLSNYHHGQPDPHLWGALADHENVHFRIVSPE